MNRSLRILLPVVFAILLPARSAAQHDYDIWCFGAGAGIMFTDSAPVPGACALNTLEGSVSIADPVTGTLLFYSDGETVFNADHRPMPNGSGLKGNLNSTQSALIVPMPGKPGVFYLFTSDAGVYDRPPNEGIHYSVIDMNLDGGRGDVTVRNVRILPGASERLTAVRHRDRCSFWVIAHDSSGDRFSAFLVNESGVSATPVVSQVGAMYHDAPGRGAGSGCVGFLKASPDGRRLVSTTFSMGIVELFRFDDATGVISDPVTLAVDGDTYGASFSPDNSKLYVSSQPGVLVQFDLSDPAAAAIDASRHYLLHETDQFMKHKLGAMQIGPDGRIYVARLNSRYLGVIAEPDAPGAACDFRLDGFDLGTSAHSWLGLPNLIDSFFDGGTLACGAPSADFVPADPEICAGECLDFFDRSLNDPVRWNWSFPGAIPASSTDRNPSGICYAEPGVYRATLVTANGFGAASATHTVIVRPRGELYGHIEGNVVAVPGDTIELPVILDAGSIPSGVGSVTFTFQYGPGMMRLLTGEIAETLLERWRIDSIADDPVRGIAVLRFVPSRGEGVQGSGTLLRLRFATFLGWADTSTVRFEVSADGLRCLNGDAGAGTVRLEFCAIEHRYIELSAETFMLGEARPNPFNPTAEIPFAIPFDAHAELVIFDASGRRVAVLVDGPLAAGRHSVRWDASALPSGIYYSRLATGGLNAMRALVLRR